MELLKNTFLYRLFKEFKLLFAVVVAWAIGTLYFALKSHEEFPFLLFGMYSLKEPSQTEYLAYSLVVDGKELVYQTMPDAQKELVATTVGNVAGGKQGLMNNTAFINWIKKYAANGKPIQVYRLSCEYTTGGAPVIKKRELLYPYPANDL